MTLAGEDKVLMLFRHAKAEHVPGKSDVERELTARGRRDAEAAGAWLHEQGLGAELVLCSFAVRTRQTWQHAEAGGACGEEVEYLEQLYAGGVDGVLQSIREDSNDAQVLLVVGHNPSMAALASMLSEGDGSRDAHEVLAAGFPTSSVAVLRYSGKWADLAPGTAALERCHVCRG
jgi:phosphohistidine phosphatase